MRYGCSLVDRVARVRVTQYAETPTVTCTSPPGAPDPSLGLGALSLGPHGRVRFSWPYHARSLAPLSGGGSLTPRQRRLAAYLGLRTSREVKHMLQLAKLQLQVHRGNRQSIFLLGLSFFSANGPQAVRMEPPAIEA